MVKVTGVFKEIEPSMESVFIHNSFLILIGLSTAAIRTAFNSPIELSCTSIIQAFIFIGTYRNLNPYGNLSFMGGHLRIK